MQVSTKLKVGVMWDHNGTYMEGLGFQYRDHSIIVEITPEDELAGEHLLAPECSNAQQQAARGSVQAALCVS